MANIIAYETLVLGKKTIVHFSNRLKAYKTYRSDFIKANQGNLFTKDDPNGPFSYSKLCQALAAGKRLDSNQLNLSVSIYIVEIK